MKENPYVFRGPVHDPAMFFGRTHELNEIAAFLRGNQSISIVGPRKVGKTSLLFHLLRPETQAQLDLSEGYLFAYLDCEVLGEGGHEDILAQFAGEIAVALDERGLSPEPALERALDKPSRLSFEGAVRKLNQRGLQVVVTLGELLTAILFGGISTLVLLVRLLALIISYGTKLIVSYLIGKLILGWIAPKIAERAIWPLMLGIVLYVIITSIPCFGHVIGFIVALIGLGAIWLLIRQSRSAPESIQGETQIEIPRAEEST